ncbi:acetyl-CoA carboxylase carboxyltransferase subunit alpha [Thermostaphylospora chromogena]|uniref:Multifunctional fusion protein n=1 Tax=Thermostaphylospora chromogena TaxID=35622 RepID=A0A1H1A7N4_9ACTN|nr:acetyl-CoA carboxylase carboxyltransferase subunit alpha [Thermostaphylospora chromogena]SDQ35629.1 acetyl-CoA carboxylase carboxyltransferase subunit alpha [Thermostaphylospora chromogena]
MDTTPQRPGETNWLVCPGCRDLVYRKRFERTGGVCPGCGRHARLTAPERLARLLDPGSATPLRVEDTAEDPLRFSDDLPYRRRLREARATTGLESAAVAVVGSIHGTRVVTVVMDFRFLGGSLGVAEGERVAAAAERALDERIPLLVVTASGGARMQEGALSLMQMAKCGQMLAMLDEAGIMTVAVLTDPTYGGVAASFATPPDVILAEPGARMGFAGPRVIEQTIRQRLPDGFQTAEFMFARGFVDAVRPRSALRPTLARLLATRAAKAPPTAAADAVLIRDPDDLPRRDPWQAVQLARHPERPTTLDYAHSMLEEFLELHGDRVSGDCPAIVGGIGRLNGHSIMLIGHQKGHTTRERVARNFGMPSPAGYRKAARLMRLAAKLGIPVLTLVDTPGAHPGVEAEEGGQAWAIARNLHLMSGLRVPIVTVITGEGGSGGALALAVADRVLALSNAIYSVISPEGCAAILWKTPAAAPAAAAALRIDARELLRHGIVDAIIPEPGAGAHAHPADTADLIRRAVTDALRHLAAESPDELVRRRRHRFRNFGYARP